MIPKRRQQVIYPVYEDVDSVGFLVSEDDYRPILYWNYDEGIYEYNVDDRNYMNKYKGYGIDVRLIQYIVDTKWDYMGDIENTQTGEYAWIINVIGEEKTRSFREDYFHDCKVINHGYGDQYLIKADRL